MSFCWLYVLNLNGIHVLFRSFHWWLWTSKYRLGKSHCNGVFFTQVLIVVGEIFMFLNWAPNGDILLVSIILFWLSSNYFDVQFEFEENPLMLGPSWICSTKLMDDYDFAQSFARNNRFLQSDWLLPQTRKRWGFSKYFVSAKLLNILLKAQLIIRKTFRALFQHACAA